MKKDTKISKSTLRKQLALTPGYILLFLWVAFTFVLIGWIVIASLSTTPEIFQNKLLASGVHFENYIKTFVTNNVGSYLWNSLIYTLACEVIIIVVAAPAAYAMSRFSFRGNKLIQLAFIAGLGIPTSMLVMPLFMTASRMNLVNNRAAIIVIYCGVILPFTTYFLMTFFRTLPIEFEMAAAIDGCSEVGTFWRIMLPLAQPGIVTVAIFNFITVWNEYFVSLIFANDMSRRPIAVGLFSMVQSMQYTGDWAGLFAAVIIVFLPTFILYLALSDKIIAGITSGGVKG